jgi:thioredoxin 1
MADSKKVELLDFWAVWCGPCKIMDPILHEIESEYVGKLTINKLNVDDEVNNDLVAKYQVMSIPTYILLVNGEVEGSFIGVTPKEMMKKQIDEALKV